MRFLINTPLLTQNSQVKEHLGVFLLDCLGGYRERETPGSIPNPEAKPLIADNTDPCRIGNVGRCLVDQFLLNLHIKSTKLILFCLHRCGD